MEDKSKQAKRRYTPKGQVACPNCNHTFVVPSRQREYQLRMKAEGRCVQCGGSQFKHELCEECYSKRQAANEKRKVEMAAYQKEYQKEYRARKKSLTTANIPATLPS